MTAEPRHLETAPEPPPWLDEEPPPPDEPHRTPRPPRTYLTEGNDLTTPPQDRDAERAVLGAMLASRDAITDVADILTGRDFYDPKHEVIYDAILTAYARLEPVDPITIGDRLTRTKDLTRVGGPAYLADLVQAVGMVTANADYYADIVRAKAHRRRLVEAGTRIIQTALADSDATPDDLHARAAEHLNNTHRGIPGVDQPHPGQTIDDFLHGDDDPYDWLVPGVLERQDRLIVTAGEGMGKSTFLRQLAVQTAAGIHPFTGERTTPIKVLLVDLENSRRQSRRKLRPLRLRAGGHLNPERLIIEIRPGGMDLTSTEDRAWLDKLIDHHRPDLLITGPIYKMASGDTDKEKDSKPVALAIDALRDRYDLAVILEAHTRKAEDAAGKKRAREPYGWSGWMRWPEFGIHLADDGKVTHWRGARDERSFPHQFNRGGPWPWTAMQTLQDQDWVAIKNAIRDSGDPDLSLRSIEVATGLSKSTVHRLTQAHAGELVTIRHSMAMAAQEG